MWAAISCCIYISNCFLSDCAARCENGGDLDRRSCTCGCEDGYEGSQCQGERSFNNSSAFNFGVILVHHFLIT